MHRGAGLAGADLLGDRHGLVDGDGIALVALRLEREAGGRRGVDPDHLAGAVDQGSSGIARLDVGIGLDQAGELLARAVAVVLGPDRLPQVGDVAVGADRHPADPSGVAQPHYGVAHLHPGRVADGRRLEGGSALQLDDADVVDAVVPDHRGGVLLAVADVRGGDAGRPRDHVIVGQDVAVAGEDYARSGSQTVLVAQGGIDVDEGIGGSRRHARQRGVAAAEVAVEGAERVGARRRAVGRRAVRNHRDASVGRPHPMADSQADQHQPPSQACQIWLGRTRFHSAWRRGWLPSDTVEDNSTDGDQERVHRSEGDNGPVRL